MNLRAQHRSLFLDASVLIGAGLILSLVIRAVLEHGMDVQLDNRYRLRDLTGNLVVIGVLWSLIGNRWKTLLIASVIIAGFQIANGVKLLVLGVPASPDDFFNVINVIHLLEGVQRVTAIALLAIPIVVLLALIRWSHPGTCAMLAIIGVITASVIHFSPRVQPQLDDTFGHSVWNQPENFRKRGLALHLTQESIRTAAKTGQTPSYDDVRDAFDTLGIDKPAPTPKLAAIEQRNVHMIVLESFFDPLQLGPDWVPTDPVDPDFRKLWAETGNSVSLSPVFGGYTANAEFEVLCGYPVTENAVFFEGWLRRPVPCLPRLLSEVGYQTLASHPNVPGFWNRTHAYRLAGFDTYLSKQHFDLTESVDGLLMDGSFFGQVFDQLPLEQGPIFNYMLTYYGHLPYPSTERYPDKVAAGRDAPLLHGYLNHVWYKTRDLMDRLDKLRAEDPDALIVIFGDHLPFLEPNYGIYSEVLGLPEELTEFTGDMLEFLVTTPLIVIDGERGPLSLGKVPMYRLPSLILDRLGVEQKGMLAWTAQAKERIYRPVYGMHFETTQDADTPARVCQPENDTTECQEGLGWLQSTRVLIADLFTGDQHALNEQAHSDTDTVIGAKTRTGTRPGNS